jgi:hypothetical protein
MNKKSMAWIVMLVLSPLAALLIAGRGSSGDVDIATYSITLMNSSSSQPLSPAAVVLHDTTYSAWEIGTAVTDGLEMLAEGGDPTDFLAEANVHTGVKMTAAGAGVVMPGMSDTVMVTVPKTSDLRVSVVTMLVNTNDAYTGITSGTVGTLRAGETMTVYPNVYDAGTEGNAESAATVPGPAAGGEGYNMARNDRDFASGHSGVVTADDGLSDSALDESHRFVGPVAKVRVTRTE